MPRQRLNVARWRSAHHQMAAERMAKPVRPVARESGAPRSAANEALNLRTERTACMCTDRARRPGPVESANPGAAGCRLLRRIPL